MSACVLLCDSYTNLMIKKLPGDYVAGFIDGEGCFYLMYRKEIRYERLNKPTYYRWVAYFAMTLRSDDINILNSIKETLDCGKVYLLNKTSKEKQAYFGIQDMDELHSKILPFFEKYPLRAKKARDFDLWREGLKVIYQNKKNRRACSVEDHQTLLEIRNKMRIYKSKLNREYLNS